MTGASAGADVNRLIGLYLSVEETSRRMLTAARDSDWDRVGALQEECGALIDEVRRLGARVALSREEQRTKLRIVRQIVQNEAQIRRLAYPWSERYEHLVFSSPPAPRVPGEA
ncbi:MAG TPA: flagellar protein FliT [Burkholderiaceae bacterium]|nr:flagellar protein FliT [Burkholderiaceae bacterium]